MGTRKKNKSRQSKMMQTKKDNKKIRKKKNARRKKLLSLVTENTGDKSDLTVTSNQVVIENENSDADERNDSPSPPLSSKNLTNNIKDQKQLPEHETENLIESTNSDCSESPPSGSSYDFFNFLMEEIEETPLLLNKKAISEDGTDQHQLFKESEKLHDMDDNKNDQNDNPNGSENSNNEMNSKDIASETAPMASTCNTQQTDKVQKNLDVLDIVEKIFKCLKSKDRQFFVDIFDMLTSMLELPKQKKTAVQDVIYTFLLNLKSCELEELQTVHDKLEDLFISKILEKITLDNASFSESKCIGYGRFGDVCLGELIIKEAKVKVAIKKPTLNPIAPKFILNEARIMCRLKHPNIMKLLSVQRKPLQIFLEYMPMGNIIEALTVKPFSEYELLKVVYDVASAMEYLAKKNFVHRDLCCKNVYVKNENGNLYFKLGGFRTCYYVGNTTGTYHETEPALLRYNVPPETLLTLEFTKKSDIYLMGFFIWELYVTGEFDPFIDQAFIKKIELGITIFRNTGELKKPSKLYDQLYNFIINKLLNQIPGQRPSFKIIKEEALDLLKKRFPIKVIQCMKSKYNTELKKDI